MDEDHPPWWDPREGEPPFEEMAFYLSLDGGTVVGLVQVRKSIPGRGTFAIG